jgi:hypothetical protein
MAGSKKSPWIDESGILTLLAVIVAAILFSRGRWTIRRVPEAREGTVSASPAAPQT